MEWIPVFIVFMAAYGLLFLVYAITSLRARYYRRLLQKEKERNARLIKRVNDLRDSHNNNHGLYN